MASQQGTQEKLSPQEVERLDHVQIRGEDGSESDSTTMPIDEERVGGNHHSSNINTSNNNTDSASNKLESHGGENKDEKKENKGEEAGFKDFLVSLLIYFHFPCRAIGHMEHSLLSADRCR